MPPYPGSAVGYFLQQQRRVRWTCDVIYHCGEVDLPRLAAAVGRDFTLANRRPPCPVPDCPGRVKFLDGGGMWPRSLDTIRDGSPAYWAFSDERAAQLKAQGWSIRMGKWVAPEGHPLREASLARV